MVKLSEIQKPQNVAQFSNKKIFIKRFCANGTFIQNQKFDNGNDFNFLPDEPMIDLYEDTELSTEELSEFEGLLDHMIEVGNTYSRMFSINPDKIIAYKQFTVRIKEYIKDKTMPSRRVFQYRIKQVIGYINKTNVKVLATTLPYAIQYIKEYIEQFITMSVNKGTSTNIAMALGMYRYLPNRATARTLQRVLKRVMMELNQKGTISKLNQKRMQIAYKDLFASLLEGIMSKIKDPMKRGMLDEMIQGLTSKGEHVVEEEKQEEESA